MKLCISPSQQNGLEEKLIYPIAQALYDLVKADNLIEVNLLSLYEGNDEASLWQAIEASNTWGADYHLAIHADAGYSATGASGLYFSDNGKKFITPITQVIMDATPWPDVGVKQRTDLGELKRTNAIAGLIELSFYDKPDELAWMQNNVDQIASILRTGIYRSLNITPVETVDWKLKYATLQNQYYSFKRDVIELTNKYL